MQSIHMLWFIYLSNKKKYIIMTQSSILYIFTAFTDKDFVLSTFVVLSDKPNLGRNVVIIKSQYLKDHHAN